MPKREHSEIRDAGGRRISVTRAALPAKLKPTKDGRRGPQVRRELEEAIDMVRRLMIWNSDPERFHVEKDAIANKLRRVVDEIA